MNTIMSTSPGEAPGHDSCACSPLQGALLDALDSAVIACNAAGTILYANARAREIWPGVVAGATGAVAACPLYEEAGAAVPRRRHPLSRALAGEPVSGESLHVRDGSEPGAVEVSAHPLDNAGVTGALLIITPYRESASEAKLRTYVSDCEILTEVSRLLADVQDAEEAASIICTVAIGSTGALAVMLWELEEGEQVLRWQEGILAPDAYEQVTDHARAGAARAIAERTTRVEHPDGDHPGERARLIGTAWHEPLMIGGHVGGALSIVWPGVLTDLDRPGWLIEALAHHAATALDRADLVRRLNAAARTDPLTGLANRRVWSERLEHEVARAGREGSPLSLILIDIDRFKFYNDRFGHPQGDELLHAAAVAWLAQVRTTDLLARIGGEEFAIVLPACPLADAVAVAERLRTAMPLEETCSLGVATSHGHCTASELYAIADAALYRAKESGRNQVQVGHAAGEQAVGLTG